MGTPPGFFQFCELKPTINGRFIAIPVGYWGRKRGPADVLIGVREGFTWIYSHLHFTVSRDKA